jgi:hypothetical protein
MTFGEDGKLYIQEDPGGTPYIALAHDFLRQRRRSTRMKKAAALLEITSILGRNNGRRYFLANMQAHCDIPGELVQSGQLYVISVVPESEHYALMLGASVLSASVSSDLLLAAGSVSAKWLGRFNISNFAPTWPHDMPPRLAQSASIETQRVE